MFSNIPGFIILDVSVFIFLVLGGLIGYYRGAARALISLIAFYIPYLLYLHFSDQISAYVDLVLDLTKTSETSSLGLIGSFSGLLGGVAIFLSFFLVSRILLKTLINHEPEIKEKLAGAVIGVGGNQIMVMVSLMLVFMTLPAATASITSTSLWWKVTKPAARAAYPLYQDLIGDRTANLQAAIAADGLIRGILAGGIDIDDSLESLIAEDAPKLAGELVVDLSGEMIENLETLDLDALQELFTPLMEEGFSAEEIDRQIRAEDARRRGLLENMDNQ